MECLIIGYGSIGKRHANILTKLGCSVNLVTSQQIDEFPYFPQINKALASKKINYAIISNPTYLHYQSLQDLTNCGYTGLVLVEKPLFSQKEKHSVYPSGNIFIGYNLRFHELLIHAKKIISDEKLITFSAYVGQYLPTWRKNTDYRKCYSAKKKYGGGVLRDLSHELDYCLWFCGQVIELTSLGGHYSSLEITSDDVYSIVMKCNSCPIVNLQLNYLDRIARREIIINTHTKTIFIDLIKGILTVNGKIQKQCYNEGEQTYFKQHMAILNNDFSNLCSYNEGSYIMELIEAIETSTLSKSWMTI